MSFSVIESLFQSSIDCIKDPTLCDRCTAYGSALNCTKVDHHPTFKALEQSALAGCVICGILKDAVVQQCHDLDHHGLQGKYRVASCLEDSDGWQSFQISFEDKWITSKAGFLTYERRDLSTLATTGWWTV